MGVTPSSHRFFFTAPLLRVAFSLAALACSSEGDKPSALGSAGAAGSASMGGGTPVAGSAARGGAGSGGQGTSTAGVAGGGGSSHGGSAGAGGAGGSSASAGATAEPSLVADPGELVFGAVQKTQTAPQSVALTNPSSTALQLSSVKLDPAAAGTLAFELVAPPAADATVAAGATVNVQVRFRPNAIALFKSALVVETNLPTVKLTVGLFGLGTKGLEGENEPFLQVVLDTLGYGVDVGGAGLLSTTTPLVGDEVAAPRFKAASVAAEIELVPVARYSPEEPIPYGYYNAAEVEVGVIANDQYQALNPTTDVGSKRSFAAPAGEFGIFTTSKTHKTYTEDTKNAANAVKHAVRTYPLKDRAGKLVPATYLVCFEEAANGDYQDYVFTLSNVVPVAPL